FLLSLSFFALVYFVVFFLQAEDGIRDATVTGVQTCALPIYKVSWPRFPSQTWANHPATAPARTVPPSRVGRCRRRSGNCSVPSRSEERRVGKEGGGREEREAWI